MTLYGEYFAGTYVVLVAFLVVCKGSAAELIGTEEAEVAGDLSGYGGGQALEEALRSLVPHDGFHHGPHSASDRTVGWSVHRHNTTALQMEIKNILRF